MQWRNGGIWSPNKTERMPLFTNGKNVSSNDVEQIKKCVKLERCKIIIFLVNCVMEGEAEL